MMFLTSMESLPAGMRLDYLVEHATPGATGTTVREHLTLFIRQDKAWCEMKISNCEGSDHAVALDKMAEWLRRLAAGIEERREVSIPM